MKLKNNVSLSVYLSVLLFILFSQLTTKVALGSQKIMIQTSKPLDNVFITDANTDNVLTLKAWDVNKTNFYCELATLAGKNIYAKRKVDICIYIVKSNTLTEWISLKSNTSIPINYCLSILEKQTISLKDYLLTNSLNQPLIDNSLTFRNQTDTSNFFNTQNHYFYTKNDLCFRWDSTYRIKEISIIDISKYSEVFHTYYFDCNTLDYRAIKEDLTFDFEPETPYLLKIKYKKAGELIPCEVSKLFTIKPLFFVDDFPAYFTSYNDAKIEWRTNKSVDKIQFVDNKEEVLWESEEYDKQMFCFRNLPESLQLNYNTTYKLKIFLKGENEAATIPFTFLLPDYISEKIYGRL